jgi:DNA repair protein RadC
MLMAAAQDPSLNRTPEPPARPLLNSVERILGYLATGTGEAGGLRVLLLDEGHRLLGEVALPGVEAAEEAVRRAGEVQAAGLVLVGPLTEASPSDEDVLRAIRFCGLASGAGLVLHDHLLVGEGATVSLRRMGVMPGMLRVN